MQLTNKSGPFDDNTYLRGKYKKFECNICYDITRKRWYYYIDSKDERDIRYNSLWDKISYNTKLECVTACQTYIDTLLKTKKEGGTT